MMMMVLWRRFVENLVRGRPNTLRTAVCAREPRVVKAGDKAAARATFPRSHDRGRHTVHEFGTSL